MIAKKDLSRSKARQVSVTNYLKKITIEDIVKWISKAFLEIKEKQELIKRAFYSSKFIDPNENQNLEESQEMEIEENDDINEAFILEEDEDEEMGQSQQFQVEMPSEVLSNESEDDLEKVLGIETKQLDFSFFAQNEMESVRQGVSQGGIEEEFPIKTVFHQIRDHSQSRMEEETNLLPSISFNQANSINFNSNFTFKNSSVSFFNQNFS